jgi:hypothetical protein
MKPIARTENDLLQIVLEFDGTMTGMMTPQVAGWLLRLNTVNRAFNQKRCEDLKSLLHRGLWMNTGEPIIVSKEGTINEGQHRLTAIHEAGIAVAMDVRFGIPQKAFYHTGLGAKRSAGDVLGIAKVPNANMCAAIAKWIWHYDQGFIGRQDHPVAPVDIHETVIRHPIISETAALAMSMRLTIIRTSWFGAVLTLVARRSSIEDARTFAQSVEDGQGDSNSATRRLHERLVAEGLTRAKIPPIDRVIISIKAWNAWVERRPVGMLKVLDSDRSSGGFPTIASTQEPAPKRRKVAV